MKSSVDKIVSNLEKVQTDLTNFLRDYSSIYRSNPIGSHIANFSGDFSFNKLRDGGINLQNKLYKQVNRVFGNIDVLLMESPEHHSKLFLPIKKKILLSIEQRGNIWIDNIEALIQTLNKEFDKITGMLKGIFEATGKVILIPDTNAIYAHPAIDQWEFADFPKFRLIITPSVLKDLDRHKIEHRNEDVRNKALKLINQIKEFRRRGDLLDGVPIKRDKIELATIAKEPDFSKSFSWLDNSNEDDRLIAETVEIIRDNAGSIIVLVTADINLQNKCGMADLHFIEPPTT